jgi:hypothetical protein
MSIAARISVLSAACLILLLGDSRGLRANWTCYTSLVCNGWDGDYCYSGYYEESCYDPGHPDIVPPEDPGGGAERWPCSNDYLPNEQDRIRREYDQFNTAEKPTCADLVCCHSSTYFSMGEYNYNGYHSLAWITGSLKTNLDGIRSDFGRAITLSSGYRCPEKNQDVGSSYPRTSRHMFGRAADIWPVGEASTQAWQDGIEDAASQRGAVVVKYSNGAVHVQWN